MSRLYKDLLDVFINCKYSYETDLVAYDIICNEEELCRPELFTHYISLLWAKKIFAQGNRDEIILPITNRLFASDEAFAGAKQRLETLTNAFKDEAVEGFYRLETLEKCWGMIHEDDAQRHDENRMFFALFTKDYKRKIAAKIPSYTSDLAKGLISKEYYKQITTYHYESGIFRVRPSDFVRPVYGSNGEATLEAPNKVIFTTDIVAHYDKTDIFSIALTGMKRDERLYGEHTRLNTTTLITEEIADVRSYTELAINEGAVALTRACLDFGKRIDMVFGAICPKCKRLVREGKAICPYCGEVIKKKEEDTLLKYYYRKY